MNSITREQSEQLQQDIITICDQYPEDLMDALCQVVVDYPQRRIPAATYREAFLAHLRITDRIRIT